MAVACLSSRSDLSVADVHDKRLSVVFIEDRDFFLSASAAQRIASIANKRFQSSLLKES